MRNCLHLVGEMCELDEPIIEKADGKCDSCLYYEKHEPCGSCKKKDALIATLREERDAEVEALQAMLDCMVTEATMDGSTHQAGPSVRRGHPWAQAVAKARKALGVDRG